MAARARAFPLLRRGLASTAAAASSSSKSATYEVPAAALASFRERGWAVLPRFLSEEEITREIEADYDRFMKGEVPMPTKDFMDMSQPFDASACAALRCEPARSPARKRKRSAAAGAPAAAQPRLGAAACRMPPSQSDAALPQAALARAALGSPLSPDAPVAARPPARPPVRRLRLRAAPRRAARAQSRASTRTSGRS